jgi:transcriptional regulator with XRE-family HTH domain
MAKPKTKVQNPIDAHAAHDARYEPGEVRRNIRPFQQVQKYEKGVNRMGASRRQHAAQILGVSVPFFFEGAQGGHIEGGDTLSPAYIDDFVSSEDGLRLIKAFTRIPRPAVRHRIVNLVHEIASGEGE